MSTQTLRCTQGDIDAYSAYNTPMNDFILIDLASQANAVAQRIAGLSAAQVVAWFRQHGTLAHAAHPLYPHMYSFRSGTGIVTGLRITDDGAVYIVTSDTTTRLKGAETSP